MNPYPDQAFAQGWHDASRLRSDVLGGHPLPEFAAGNMRLYPDEVLHGNAPLTHEVWCAMDVTYQRTGLSVGPPVAMAVGLAASLIGNSIRRSRAEQKAMHQWRWLGWAPTLVTNCRILAHLDSRWYSWSLDSVMELWPSPGSHSFVILLDGENPLRVSGPWAPWHCVVLAYLLYGPDYLVGHPEFQAMGQVGQGQVGQGQRRHAT